MEGGVLSRREAIQKSGCLQAINPGGLFSRDGCMHLVGESARVWGGSSPKLVFQRMDKVPPPNLERSWSGGENVWSYLECVGFDMSVVDLAIGYRFWSS